MPVKKLILQKILACYEDWSRQFSFACGKGCALCCTQDVTLTAVEAGMLLDFIRTNNMEPWLHERLGRRLPQRHLRRTTNEYARACLRGEEIPIDSGLFDAVCPFLEDNLCRVYPARPFSCRCFASTGTCRAGQSASLPSAYLSGATAVSQIIEHLGQFDHWGNMLDVLNVLIHDSAESAEPPNTSIATARSACLVAQPLPGFLIGEEDADLVVPLIESIFATRIDARTIEEILNGG